MRLEVRIIMAPGREWWRQKKAASNVTGEVGGDGRISRDNSASR